MDPDVLSYARPIPADPPPDNPLTIVAICVGGIGWAAVVGVSALSFLAQHLNVPGDNLPDAVGWVLGAVLVIGAVLMPSGALLGLTAVLIGPGRWRATRWLAAQVALHVSTAYALSQM